MLGRCSPLGNSRGGLSALRMIEDWEFTPTVQGRFFRERMRMLNPEVER